MIPNWDGIYETLEKEYGLSRLESDTIMHINDTPIENKSFLINLLLTGNYASLLDITVKMIEDNRSMRLLNVRNNLMELIMMKRRRKV